MIQKDQLLPTCMECGQPLPSKRRVEYQSTVLDLDTMTYSVGGSVRKPLSPRLALGLQGLIDAHGHCVSC